MKQVKLPLFVLVCLGAAAWAFYLIGVHFDVVAGLEGGACGEGQGCGNACSAQTERPWATSGCACSASKVQR